MENLFVKGQISRRNVIIVTILVIVVAIVGIYFAQIEETETKETVKIGIIGPMNMRQGKAMEHSVKLAAKEINNNGGILGREIEVIIRSTEMDPNVGTANFRKLTVDEEVDVIIGGFSSGVVTAMQDTMAELDQLFLGDAVSPEHTARVEQNYEDYKYYFRVPTSNIILISKDLNAMLIDYLKQEKNLPIEKVGIIRDDAAWAQGFVTNLVKPPLENAGIEVVRDDPVPTGVTGAEFASILESHQNAGVDVIVPCMAHVDAVPLVKTWSEMEPNALLAGFSVAMLNLEGWEITDGACKYTAFLAMGGMTYAPITSRTIPFIERYENRWGVLPEANVGYGFYDAVYMYKQAVEWAQENGEENPFDSSTLVSYLEKFDEDNPYPSVRGRNAFTKSHDLMWGTDYVRNWPFQWMGSKEQVLVWPPEKATGDFTIPPWVNPSEWAE